MSNNKDPQSGIKVSHQKSKRAYTDLRGRESSPEKPSMSEEKFSALINSYIDQNGVKVEERYEKVDGIMKKVIYKINQ